MPWRITGTKKLYLFSNVPFCSNINESTDKFLIGIVLYFHFGIKWYPFQPLTKAEIIGQLDESREQYKMGKYKDADDFGDEMMEKYGL